MVTAIVDKAPSGASDTLVCATFFFMPITENEILNLSIKNLPFSEDFKSVSQKSSFNTIGEIIDKPVAELLKIDGFTYHLLQELIQFLEEKGLANLLKE